MCAFDLLATVAGTLLADQDNPDNVANTSGAEKAKNKKAVEEEHCDEIPPLDNMALEKDCCNGCVVGSGGICAFPGQANNCSAENSSTINEDGSMIESLTVKSNMFLRDSLVSCTRPCETSCGLGIIPEVGAHGTHQPGCSISAEMHQAGPKVVTSQADGHAVVLHSLFDSMDLDVRPALVSSDSSSCVPLCNHDKDHQTASLHQDEVQYTADRDDDENSSGCTHPSTTGYNGHRPQYPGSQRIRKLLASKVRKAARNKICGGIPSKKICGGMSNKGMPIPCSHGVSICIINTPSCLISCHREPCFLLLLSTVMATSQHRNLTNQGSLVVLLN
jgi:hypothetical protein